MKIVKRLSIVFIIAGLLIAAIPLIGQWYTNYQESKLISELMNGESTEATEPAAASDPQEAYSSLQGTFENAQGIRGLLPKQEPTGPAAPEKPQAAPKPEVKQTVLGIIQIKKIKVKCPIVEGVESYNLKVGIGHIPGTARIGQPGNCALAGHRSYTFGRFFNRLDEVNVGDEILISTKKEDLTYKVYKKLVVEPTDISVLDWSGDDSIITLITCTPIYIASHRLILHARLEERVSREP